MAKRLKDNNERIVSRSIGFNMRQILFFSEHQDFKPDAFCREAIDKQIELIDRKFLRSEDEKTNN